MRVYYSLLAVILCAASVLVLADEWSVPASWDVEQREVKFENDGIEFVGTLHLPAGSESGPAVVVTHGSGLGNKDAALYQQLAELLPVLGYAVLVYDRRGAGESGGELAGASYRDLARDAVAAMDAISTDSAVDEERVGLWGLSQGGWIVMEAASMTEPAFVIAASTPLTTPARQMEILAYNETLRAGHDEQAARQALSARRTVDGYFRGEVDLTEAREILSTAEQKPWYQYTGLPPAEALPENVEGSSWLLEMDYDPTEALEALEVPLLFILGGEDFVIPVAESLEILDNLPGAEERTVVVIPGADHVLRISVEGETDAELAPDSKTYFLLMGHWLGSLGLDQS